MRVVESAPGCGQMKFTRQDIGMIDLHAYHTHIHMRTCMHACMHACVRAHTHAHTHTRSLTAHGPWEIPPQAHDTHTRGRKREREREREVHVAACCSSNSLLMHFPTRPSASLPLPSCALSSPNPVPRAHSLSFWPLPLWPHFLSSPLSLSLSLSPFCPASHALLPLTPPLLLL